MITGMEIKELKATKTITLSVQMQIFEKEGKYKVMMHPSIHGLSSVHISRTGNKEDAVAEALREFQEMNGVRLRYDGCPIPW